MRENLPHDREDPINEEAADWEEAGLPAQEDSTEDITLPSDRPYSMSEQGTTGTEKEAGEPLDTALARDRSDIPGAVGSAAPASGESAPPPAEEPIEGIRIAEEDEGIRYDREGTLIGRDVGEDRGAFTAEEQAVHTEDESEAPE